METTYCKYLRSLDNSDPWMSYEDYIFYNKHLEEAEKEMWERMRTIWAPKLEQQEIQYGRKK